MPYLFRWILLLPFFGLAWVGLSRICPLATPYRRIALTLASGAAVMLGLVALAGHFTFHLLYALVLGSALAAVGTLAWWKFSAPPAKASWILRPSVVLILIWISGLVLTFMVAMLALKFSFHDQMRIQAHPPLIESLTRGNLPPRLMAFPEIPLKYHWGADLFGAIGVEVTGWPGYKAIDLTMIFGWITLLACLYTFCREAGMDEKWTLLALLWIPLAAGWAYLLKSHLATPQELLNLNYDWPDSKRVFGRHLNPGNISNFFMTPSSLGMPLFFAYLILLTAWLKNRAGSLLVSMAVFLGCFSLIQAPYFVTALSSTLLLLAAQAILERISWKKAALEFVLFFLLSFGLALALGGFLTRDPGYDPQSLLFNWPPGYLRNATWGGNIPISAFQALLWYLSTFGSSLLLALPALVFALPLIKKEHRLLGGFLLAYAVQSWTVAQFFRYKYTWDIIKWFTAFHTAILILVVLLVSQTAWKKRWIAACLFLLMLLDTLPSWRFLYSLSFLKAEQVKSSQREWWTIVIPEPDPVMREIIQMLKSSAWDQAVLSTPRLSALLSEYSGQAMLSLDLNTLYFGVDPRRIQARKALLAELQKNFSIEKIREAGGRWLVFSCGEFASFFSAESQAAIQSAVETGTLKERRLPTPATCWRIYQLLD